MKDIIPPQESIKEQFPNMNDEEVEIEFLMQGWLAAENNIVEIFMVKEDGETGYLIVGKSISPADSTANSKPISSDEFFDNVLSGIIIAAIEKGYTYVVDITGNGDYAIKNAHEINMQDFFAALSRDKAIQFIQDLVDDDEEV